MSKKDNLQSQEEDLKAIRLALDGNQRGFEFLQKKYKRIINTIIRKMVKNQDDVDDLTQETFIKAFTSLNKFNQQYPFSSWIFRIASNTCIDFMRKKRFQTLSIYKGDDSKGDEDIFEIKDTTYSADKPLLKEERKEIIERAINNLPENYRIIIKLRHEEEIDYNEISKRLNLPLGTVKAHLFRARKLLLIELKKNIGLFTGII